MSETPQNPDSPQHMEQRILRVMRKVLAKIVREVAPRPGTVGPLSDDTVEDIRQCFNLISIREREIAEAQNMAPQKPFYPDQPQSAKVVKITARKKGKDDSEK